jgi:hypothetical protein
MDRTEHLQWCKDRAIKYFATGDNAGGAASFASDMSKHEETENHLALRFMMIELMSGRSMIEYVQGFN